MKSLKNLFGKILILRITNFPYKFDYWVNHCTAGDPCSFAFTYHGDFVYLLILGVFSWVYLAQKFLRKIKLIVILFVAKNYELKLINLKLLIRIYSLLLSQILIPFFVSLYPWWVTLAFLKLFILLLNLFQLTREPLIGQSLMIRFFFDLFKPLEACEFLTSIFLNFFLPLQIFYRPSLVSKMGLLVLTLLVYHQVQLKLF